MSKTVHALGAVLLLAGLASPATAEVWVYGLNLKGKVTCNTVILENNGSNFSDDPPRNVHEAWADLQVEGEDRYVLRRDGRIKKNNENFADLPGSVLNGEYWISLSIDGGTVWSVNQAGLIGRNDDVLDVIPAGDFVFTSSVVRGGTLYSLRSDGAIFRGTEQIPSWKFTAGTGTSGRPDGEASDTVWISIVLHPTNNRLYALRGDGRIYRTTSDGILGQEVERLPFPASGSIETADLYAEVEFMGDGSWVALRRNGEIYTQTSPFDPVVDYPGNANSDSDVYVDLETSGMNWIALRSNGRVYADLSTTEIVNLDGDLYTKLAIGDEAPNLDSAKNEKPVATTYNTTTVVGTPVTVPITVTDVNEAEEDLLITVTEIPPGSVYDPNTRLLTWNNPGPKGNYKFKFTADDGVNKPKKFTNKIKVKDPNPKPDKNKKPFAPKIKKGQPIVEIPYQMLIVVDDPDGDDLTVTFDPAAYPFNAGATYDDSTRIFSWTPRIADIGKPKVQFEVTDGINKPVKISVKLTVVNSLTVQPIDL